MSFGYANHQTIYPKNFSLPSGYSVVSHTNAVCVFSNIKAYHPISAADRDSDSLWLIQAMPGHKKLTGLDYRAELRVAADWVTSTGAFAVKWFGSVHGLPPHNIGQLWDAGSF